MNAPNPSYGESLANRDPAGELKALQASARRWRDVLTALLGAALAAGLVTAPEDLSKLGDSLNLTAISAAVLVGVLVTIALIHAAAAGDPRSVVQWSVDVVEARIDRTAILLDRAQVISYAAVLLTALTSLTILASPALQPEGQSENLIRVVDLRGQIFCGPLTSVEGQPGAVTVDGANIGYAREVQDVESCVPKGSDATGSSTIERLAPPSLIGVLVAILVWLRFPGPATGGEVRFYTCVLMIAVCVSVGVLALAATVSMAQKIDWQWGLVVLGLIVGSVYGAIVAGVYPSSGVFSPGET